MKGHLDLVMFLADKAVPELLVAHAHVSIDEISIIPTLHLYPSGDDGDYIKYPGVHVNVRVSNDACEAAGETPRV